MKYVRPEVEWIRFESGDILTESSELPIVPAKDGDEQNGGFTGEF